MRIDSITNEIVTIDASQFLFSRSTNTAQRDLNYYKMSYKYSSWYAFVEWERENTKAE